MILGVADEEMLKYGAMGVLALVLLVVLPGYQKSMKITIERFMKSLDARDQLIAKEGRLTRKKLHRLSGDIQANTLQLKILTESGCANRSTCKNYEASNGHLSG